MSSRQDGGGRPSGNAANERPRHPSEHRRRNDQPRSFGPPHGRAPRDGPRDGPRHDRSSSGPPRSYSDAEQIPEPPPRRLSDAGPGLQAGTPPKAAPVRGGGLSSSNTLAAEAARHLRELKAREAEAARRSSEHLRAMEDGLDRSPGAKRDGGNRWADVFTEDSDDGQEDGELAPDQQAPASKRARHSPIVWARRDKQPAEGGSSRDGKPGNGAPSASREPHMDKVESTTRLEGLLDGGSASPTGAAGPQGHVRPRSAAEQIAAEAEDFRRRATLEDAEGDGIDPAAPPAMRASPSGSDDGGTAAAVEGGAVQGVASPEANSVPPSQPAGGRSRWLDQDEDRELETVTDMEAAEARLNAEERAAAEAGSSLDLRMRPVIAAMDVFTEDSDDEDMPDTSDGRNLSMLQECRPVEMYKRIRPISEGTYGMVYQAHVVGQPDKVVALKKVKLDQEKHGFPLTALREVNILLSFHHANIVDVKEVVVGNSLASVYMVMEYMEHDLKALMEFKKEPFSVAEVKCVMYQLFDGIEYLHDNWVLHRDLKTSNILYNNKGEVKICDFGLARQYGSPLKPYTGLVVTLHYRAPELLLSEPRYAEYSTAIDMWSLGCIMGELLKKKTLFDGKGELEQMHKIFGMLGAPNDAVWPGWSKLPSASKIAPAIATMNKVSRLRQEFPAHTAYGQGLTDAGFDLLDRLLALDPARRITAKEALDHRWFREAPQMKDKILMPTFPERHRNKGINKTATSPGDPRVANARRQIADLAAGGGFSLK